jgi:signal transduction histidine kinase
MVGHLLDLTALQQGRLRMSPQKVAVAPLVSRVVAATPAPENKSVEIFITERVIAFVDPARLEQIVVNLLTNAYRYGGDSIRIEAGNEAARTYLRVEDNGSGIPDDLVPTLFEPFSRGDESAAIGGSGLGLSIVKSLAETSEGAVVYEAGASGGAAFTVWLPSHA